MVLFAAGKQQMPFVTMGAGDGRQRPGGPGDSLFIVRGKLAESNAEQVGTDPRILVRTRPGGGFTG